MARLTQNDWKGLWAILWRILIFGPIVGLLGLALFFLVIAGFAGLPIYAALAFFTGDWILGIVALSVWAVVLRFRRPLLRWAFEGFEYAGI